MNKKRINWQKTISRCEDPIRSELITRGACLNVEKLIGVKNNNFLFILDNGKGSAYFDPSQIRAMGKSIARKIDDDIDYPEKHIKELLISCEYLVRTSKDIEKEHLSRVSLSTLKTLFDKFVKAHLLFSPYMMIPIAVEKVIATEARDLLLENKLINRDGKKLELYLAKLLVPSKRPAVSEELSDFSKIVAKAGSLKKEELQQLIKEHWGKYRWLAVYSPSHKPYSLSYFERKLKEEKPIKKNPRRKEPPKFSETVKELGIRGEFLRKVELLREYVYLRTFRVEQLSKAYFYIQPLLKEIAKRGGLSLYELCLCSLDEIIEFFEKTKLPNKQELNKRKVIYVYVIRDGRFESFSGSRAEKIIEKEIKLEEPIVECKELKGTPASRGVGKGLAHLISDITFISKFKNGEVLITTMTNPDFVIAMKKAAAIVTDEGGVLCHAAIVSRELGVPCVVGTKIATKVFKDGDLLEVDAERGIVRKFEK